MRERIRDAWEQLETGAAEPSGMRRLRLSPDLHADLFGALRYPEMTRMLLLRLPLSILRELSPSFVQLRGVRTRPMLEPEHEGIGFISLALVEPRFRDLFDILIADLAEALFDQKAPREQGKALIARLTHWRVLFAAYQGEVMSPEARTGLYGELRWLRTLIESGTPNELAIGSWQGSPGGDHDFVAGTVAVEVKTTTKVGSLHIGSERQLDEAPFSVLILVHQQAHVDPGGDTLPEEIDVIRAVLSGQGVVSTIFEARLAQAGYSDAQREDYGDLRYVLDATRAYRVAPGFPRLAPGTLPTGVGEVSYTVDPAACEPFFVQTEVALRLFQPHE